MIYENATELKERAESLSGRRIYGAVKVVEDTSNYMAIAAHMVLRLAGNDYFVLGDAKEGRFGISEQPKLWVKYTIDLTTGTRKIVKLVCREEFSTNVGMFKVRCRRSAEKESEVLRVVQGDSRFMQGVTVYDTAGNTIRVLDHISGTSFFNYIAMLEQPHEQYYHEMLPGILRQLVGSIDAIGLLHRHGLDHGDIRNDHILIEAKTGQYRWIDFDYTVNYSDYDIWSMGNVLTYAVAKGIITCRDAIAAGRAGASGTTEITAADALLFYGYRLANLRKALPYVDPTLNEMLMRFSAGTTDFFIDFAEMSRVLRAIVDADRSSPE